MRLCSARARGFLQQVIRPHDEAGEAVGRVGPQRRDLAHVEDRARRLHHGPQPRLGRRVDVGQHLDHREDVARLGNLGHQDRIGGDAHGRPQVVHAPRRLDGIGANDELAPPVAAGLHRRADAGARRRLRLGRNGILQIEDQRIGGKRLRLLERALVGARHIEDAAAWADVHANPPCALHNSARRGEHQGMVHNLLAPGRSWGKSGKTLRSPCRWPASSLSPPTSPSVQSGLP